MQTCEIQEVQSHTHYCFMWERGCSTSLCSDKQKLLGVFTIDKSMFSVVSGFRLRPCNLELCLSFA